MCACVCCQLHEETPILVDGDPLSEEVKATRRKSAVTCGKIRASCVGYRWVADGPLGMPFSDFPLLLPRSSRVLSLSLSLPVLSSLSLSLSRVSFILARASA